MKRAALLNLESTDLPVADGWPTSEILACLFIADPAGLAARTR